MGKYIEVAASYVDRDTDPNQGRGLGMIRWDAEDPASDGEVMNPVDPKVLLMLKAFIARHEREVDSLRAKLERR